ncbi:hypothetical protein pb186bvf_009065 [Paramecium bursaria]
MFQSQRFCIIKGHENFQSSHICTFKECDQITRWVCVECTAKQIHSHQQIQTKHIMNKEEFTIYINQEVNNESKVKKEEIQFYITKLHKIKKQIKQLQEYFTSFYEVFDNQDVSQVKKTLEEDYLSLSSEQISKAVKKLQNIQAKYHRNLVIDFIQSIQTQLNVTIDKNTQHQEGSVSNINENLTFINYFELQSNQQILSAQISPNEQYLAFGGKLKSLMIYNLTSKQLIREIKLDQMINVCEFSEDSQHLYVGCQNGYICCFDSGNNFRQVCYQQIHNDNIYGLTQKSSYLITSCMTDIIVTDQNSLIQVVKIADAHRDCINSIDYNTTNDVIVSGSQDQSIKLFQGKTGKVLIDKQNAHQQGVDQIKFINNLKIVSLDQNNILRQWQIDYFNKDIKCINELEDINYIYNFINIKLNLITICQNFVKIYDDNFQFKYQLSHPQGEDVWCKKILQFRYEHQVIEFTKLSNYSRKIKVYYHPKKQNIQFLIGITDFIPRIAFQHIQIQKLIKQFFLINIIFYLNSYMLSLYNSSGEYQIKFLNIFLLNNFTNDLKQGINTFQEQMSLVEDIQGNEFIKNKMKSQITCNMNHDKNNRAKESEAVIRPFSHIDLSHFVHSKAFLKEQYLLKFNRIRQ